MVPLACRIQGGRFTSKWRNNGRDGVSNHQPHDCLLNRLFCRRSKKTSKLRVTGLCAGNSPVTGEFPAQMSSNAENVSIWWRHHAIEQSSVENQQWNVILLEFNTLRCVLREQSWPVRTYHKSVDKKAVLCYWSCAQMRKCNRDTLIPLGYRVLLSLIQTFLLNSHVSYHSLFRCYIYTWGLPLWIEWYVSLIWPWEMQL